MDYLLSKLLPLLVYPLGLAVILCILILLAGWKGNRTWINLVLVIVILLLWVPSTSVFADFLMQSLERQYPPVAADKLPRADAIVILGGMTSGVVKGTEQMQFSDSVDRLFFGSRLYLEKKAPVIVLAGGSGKGFTPESVLMAQVLEQFDIPYRDMLLETRSRNTYQNAVNIKQLLEEHGISKILLVTSAFHMKRAAGLFKAKGFDLVPAPTDYHLIRKESSVIDWLPSADALSMSTLCIKEYIGWVYYMVKGWV